MRRTLLVPAWGLFLTLLCSMGTFGSFAGSAGSYQPVTITDLPFNMVVRELVKERGSTKGVFLYDEVSTRVSVNDNGNTSIDALLAGLCAQVGLSFRQDDTTYYIGTPAQLAGTAANNDDGISPPPVNIADYPKTPVNNVSGTPIKSSADSFVIRTVQLNNISASEIAWMLGYKSTGIPNQQRRDRLSLSLRSVLDPRRPVVNGNSESGSYNSSTLGNFYSRQGSYSDANVFPPINPPVNPPINPINPPVNPPINPINPNNPVNPNNPNNTPGGVLKKFHSGWNPRCGRYRKLESTFCPRD